MLSWSLRIGHITALASARLSKGITAVLDFEWVLQDQWTVQIDNMQAVLYSLHTLGLVRFRVPSMWLLETGAL